LAAPVAAPVTDSSDIFLTKPEDVLLPRS
jgi:hypothetical protein